MRLDARHYKAIFLLVSGKTHREVAKSLKIDETTVSKWRNDDDFREQLQKTYSRVYDDALNKLAAISIKAANYLEKLIDDCEVPARVKLQAIGLILNHGEKVKQYSLENRLEKLEKLLLNEETK